MVLAFVFIFSLWGSWYLYKKRQYTYTQSDSKTRMASQNS